MKKLVLIPIALLLSLTVAIGDPLSRHEIKRLKEEIAKAASDGNWDAVGGHLRKLADADDKKTWKYIVRVCEKAPPFYELHVLLHDLAEKMNGRGVQDEIRRTALHSKSAPLRKQMIIYLANRKEWDVLIGAIRDDDEEVAAVAAWRLVDARVEVAVEPMIAELERLERDRAGIWDVLRNGLGKLLGMRCDTAMEYESLWQIVQERGGLRKVVPEKEAVVAPGELRSMSIRLFGREIDCTRVVFILDVSGSMEAIDPRDHEGDGDWRSRTRGGDGSPEDSEEPKGPTRLERAQRELKNVIEHLPANFRINIIAYSSRVALWRAHDGDIPPRLHALNEKNRKSACKFVDRFRADGVTCTDSALLRAYEVEGARCFYLLSDGKATHDGETKVPTDDVLRLVDDFKDRHVIIHTLGFRGADKEMMQALARHTGGKYSDIR